MTVEVGLEYLLHKRDALVRPELVEAQPLPGLLRALDDTGRGVVVEPIGVDPDPTGLRFLEYEGEGVEDPVGTEPDVLVLAHVYVSPEVVFVESSHPAVDAVAADDQVGVGAAGEILDLGLEPDVGPQVHRSLAQDVE